MSDGDRTTASAPQAHRWLDISLRLAIIIFTLYVLLVCPRDAELSSAVCRCLYLYRLSLGRAASLTGHHVAALIRQTYARRIYVVRSAIGFICDLITSPAR